MPDFPLSPVLINATTIGTFSRQSIGLDLRGHAASTSTSTAWPSANLAIYIPVEIYQVVTIVKMAVNNGTAVSGNIDVGIYDVGGAKLVTKGSTAQAGTSAIQIFDITDTLLLPGLYYMAVALDNTTGTLAGWTVATQVAQSMGAFQQASAFALPTSSATFAAFAQTFMPMVTMFPRSTI